MGFVAAADKTTASKGSCLVALQLLLIRHCCCCNLPDKGPHCMRCISCCFSKTCKVKGLCIQHSRPLNRRTHPLLSVAIQRLLLLLLLFVLLLLVLLLADVP